MTRLRKEDIREVGSTLRAYDTGLVRKTGRTLKQIGMQASGLSAEEMENALCSNNVAVVPMTCGQGMIEGFVETVRDILDYLGANVFQTAASDAGGLAEAVGKEADIIFCADDQKFIALHLALKRVIDNADSTARGYVEALECASGNLNGQEVLVIGGAGQVGWNAVLSLEKKGARISIYDIHEDRVASRLRGHEIQVERDLGKALEKHHLLFDASPAAGFIEVRHIGPQTVIAAPGIPLGLTGEAYLSVQDRLIHDPLQIGVTTMLTEALLNPEKRYERDRQVGG